jgi:hypothetical protein
MFAAGWKGIVAPWKRLIQKGWLIFRILQFLFSNKPLFNKATMKASKTDKPWKKVGVPHGGMSIYWC